MRLKCTVATFVLLLVPIAHHTVSANGWRLPFTPCGSEASETRFKGIFISYFLRRNGDKRILYFLRGLVGRLFLMKSADLIFL